MRVVRPLLTAQLAPSFTTTWTCLEVGEEKKKVILETDLEWRIVEKMACFSHAGKYHVIPEDHRSHQRSFNIQRAGNERAGGVTGVVHVADLLTLTNGLPCPASLVICGLLPASRALFVPTWVN